MKSKNFIPVLVLIVLCSCSTINQIKTTEFTGDIVQMSYSGDTVGFFSKAIIFQEKRTQQISPETNKLLWTSSEAFQQFDPFSMFPEGISFIYEGQLHYISGGIIQMTNIVYQDSVEDRPVVTKEAEKKAKVNTLVEKAKSDERQLTALKKKAKSIKAEKKAKVNTLVEKAKSDEQQLAALKKKAKSIKKEFGRDSDEYRKVQNLIKSIDNDLKAVVEESLSENYEYYYYQYSNNEE